MCMTTRVSAITVASAAGSRAVSFFFILYIMLRIKSAQHPVADAALAGATRVHLGAARAPAGQQSTHSADDGSTPSGSIAIDPALSPDMDLY